MLSNPGQSKDEFSFSCANSRSASPPPSASYAQRQHANAAVYVAGDLLSAPASGGSAAIVQAAAGAYARHRVAPGLFGPERFNDAVRDAVLTVTGDDPTPEALTLLVEIARQQTATWWPAITALAETVTPMPAVYSTADPIRAVVRRAMIEAAEAAG